MSDKNLPAIQSKQIEAAQMVEKYRSEKTLVFVNAEDLKTHALFIPEVTLLKTDPKNDFHKISGKLMPKSHIVDRIGDASGVSFIAAECQTRAENEWVYVGRAQGKKRLPDGTWRASQVHEYEFDVATRAELDFMKGNYPTDAAKRKHKLEMKKFARQRAGTGARLKVIKELVGMATSFDSGELKDGQMVLARVALNTQRMLAEPEMRNAIIQNAIGATEEIFGPAERNVTPDREALPEPTTDGKPNELDDDGSTAEPQQQALAGIPDGDIPWGTELEKLRSWFQMRIAEVPAEDTKAWLKDFLAGKGKDKDGNDIDSQDIEVLKKYKTRLEEKLAAAGGAK